MIRPHPLCRRKERDRSFEGGPELERSSRLGILAAVLTFILALTACRASAAGDISKTILIPKRMITIVLDDSGSMIFDGRWETSLYALEVFASMLNTDDVLNVRILNDTKQLMQLRGNDPDRIRTLRARMQRISPVGTPPVGSTRNGAEDLLRASSDYEKWLIILSDGDDALRTVRSSDFDLWNGNNVNTIVLNIDLPPSDDFKGAAGRFLYTSRSTLFGTLSDISNYIYKRLVLPDSRIGKSGNRCVLDIDIPIDQLIVFVQGKSVSAGKTEKDGTAVTASADLAVEGTNGSTEARGRVIRFESPGSYFDKGTWSIDITGDETIEIYYRPAVSLECSLVNDSGTIYAGEVQKARVWFCHPGTGEKISSDLLGDASIYLTVTNNGKELLKNVKADKDGTVREVVLDEGVAVISAHAELPGDVTLEKPETSYPVTKRPPSILIDPVDGLDADGTLGTVRQIDLKGNTAIRFRIRIIGADTREPIDEAWWNGTSCTVDPAHGVKVEASKAGLACPYFDLIPSAEGKVSDVQTGIAEFSLYVRGKDGNITKKPFRLRIIPYDPVELPGESAALEQYLLGKTNTSHFVTVHALDPETKGPLGDGVFSLTELTVLSDTGTGLDWRVEKTAAAGEWKLIPSATDKKADISVGTRTVRVRAVYDDGDDFTGAKAILREADIVVDISATPPRSLDLSADVPTEPYIRDRWSLAAGGPIRVAAGYEGGPVPAAAWSAAGDDSLALTPVGGAGGDRIAFEIVKGASPGTWEVRVKPFLGKGYLTSRPGHYEFRVQADLYDPVDEIPYSGTVTVAFDIAWSRLVLWEFVVDWWWAILAACYIIGWLIQKKFAAFAMWQFLFRRFEVKYTAPSEQGIDPKTADVRLRGSVFRYLFPVFPLLCWFPQQLTLDCQDGCRACRFGDVRISAAKRGFHFSHRFLIKKADLANADSVGNLRMRAVRDITEKQFCLKTFRIKGNTDFGTVTVYRKKHH